MHSLSSKPQRRLGAGNSWIEVGMRLRLGTGSVSRRTILEFDTDARGDKSRRCAVRDLVEGTLVLLKVQLRLELLFLLLPGAIAQARFIQPEQNTRRVRSR